MVLADLALGVALVATLAFAARRAAFVVAGVACFAVSAALVLAGDESDDLGGSEDPEPRWWPDFERDFRAYGRPRTRPRALR